MSERSMFQSGRGESRRGMAGYWPNLKSVQILSALRCRLSSSRHSGCFFDRLKREFEGELDFSADNTAISKNGAIFLAFVPNKLSLSASLTDSGAPTEVLPATSPVSSRRRNQPCPIGSIRFPPVAFPGHWVVLRPYSYPAPPLYRRDHARNLRRRKPTTPVRVRRGMGDRR